MPDPALLINIARLSESGADFQFHLEESWFARWQTQDPGLEFAGPGSLEVQVHLERHGHDILVRGHLGGSITLSCGRCLTPFSYPVTVDFDLLLAPGPVFVNDKDLELTPEDLDLDFYEGEVVDLERLLKEQVLLQFPLKPLCRETCKGICPGCGADLNQEPCRCALHQTSSPFAQVKKPKA
jgi:uncharacterized protein